MKSNLLGAALPVEMTSNCIGNLLLQFPQVLSLSRYATFATGSVPPGHKEAGILTWLDLENDFVHVLTVQRGQSDSQSGCFANETIA